MFTYNIKLAVKRIAKLICTTHQIKSKTSFHFFAPCILCTHHARYRMHRGAREPFKPPKTPAQARPKADRRARSPAHKTNNPTPMCPRKPPGKPVWGILVVDILIPYNFAYLHKPPSRTCCSTSAAVSAMAELFGILDLSYRAQESDNNARGIR